MHTRTSASGTPARTPAGVRPVRAHRRRAAGGDAAHRRGRASGARRGARPARAVRRSAALLAAGAAEIRAQRGLGPARAAQIKAMVEFVRRSLLEEAAQRDALTSPDAVRDYLRLTLAALPLRSVRRRSSSTARTVCSRPRSSSAARWRRPASIRARSSRRRSRTTRRRVIFAHNHPSGVAEPSPGRRAADGGAEAGAGAGRHPDARPLRRGRSAGRVVRGARARSDARLRPPWTVS